MKEHSYFLDSNVIVSGIAWDGNERRLLEMGMSQKIELVTCSYALREIERVLSKFGYSLAMIIDELLHLRAFIRIVDPTEDEIRERWNALPDKSDVPVLTAIIKSGCIFVTGDKKLRKNAAK
ncbi:MAG: putative toxin-antitoxin system toxin component, PIN family, partial [Thermoplasmata archaeon]